MKHVIVAVLLCVAADAHAQNFPPDAQWVPFQCGRAPMSDALGDEPGAANELDVVGSFDAPAGMRTRDANFLFLRLRLDQPALPTGAGAWGYEFDIDNDPTTYELLALVDKTGAGQGNVVVLRNTTTTTPNAPTDPAEMQVMLFPAASHAQSRVAADSQFGGNPDSWIEFAIPWNVVMPLGLTPTTPLRVWAASSTMNDRLDADFACHDGGSGEPTLDGIASDRTVLDPIVDTDGDGFTDAQEIADGTDPNDPNSRPESSRLEGGGGCRSGGDSPWALIAVPLVVARRARGSRARPRRV